MQAVPASEAAAYAAEIDALFFETSCVTRSNVHLAFESVVSRLPDLHGSGDLDDTFYRTDAGGGGGAGGKGDKASKGVVNPAAKGRGGSSGGGGGCC